MALLKQRAMASVVVLNGIKLNKLINLNNLFACVVNKVPRPISLQVHHIIPFHYCVALGRPDLELDDRNLISLCESVKGKECNNHHLLVGHLDNFKSANLSVTNDCRFYASLSKQEIESNSKWIAEKVCKLIPLDLMTSDEIASLKNFLTAQFPIIVR